MSFTVVCDACVLYPAPLRDLLIRLVTTGLFRAKWTDEILDECFEAILENRPDLTKDNLRRTREFMVRAVRDCMVTGYERFIDVLELPDPDDRHVLAAGVRAGAQVIVTQNLDDFPSAVLAEYDIEAQLPDEFVVNVIDLDQRAVCRVVQQQTAALKNPPRTEAEVLDTLESQGLVQTVAILRRRL